MHPYKTNIIPETPTEKKRRVDKAAADKFVGRKRNDDINEQRRIKKECREVWETEKWERD